MPTIGEAIDKLRKEEAEIAQEINKPKAKSIEHLKNKIQEYKKEYPNATREEFNNYFSTNLVADGIINIPNYLTAPCKILWILREPNLPGEKFEYDEENYPDYYEVGVGEKDLVHSKEDATADSLWKIDGIWTLYTKSTKKPDMYGAKVERRVMITSDAIFKSIIEGDPVIPTCIIKNQLKSLQSVALINIKKIGGKGESKKDEIAAAYKKNKNLLKKQIDIYNPQIIICGHTLHHFINDKYFEDYFKTKNSKLMDFNSKLYGFDISPNPCNFKYYLSEDRVWINAYHPKLAWNNRGNYKEAIQEDERDYIEKIVNAVLDWKDNYYGK